MLLSHLVEPTANSWKELEDGGMWPGNERVIPKEEEEFRLGREVRKNISEEGGTSVRSVISLKPSRVPAGLIQVHEIAQSVLEIISHQVLSLGGKF